MSTVPVGTLAAGTLFEYETKMDGRPYKGIGKVIAQRTKDHATVMEDEYGNSSAITDAYMVTPE